MNTDQILKKLDELRIEADRLIQIAEAIKNSEETTLAWRSLQLAKGYLGKIKGLFGVPTPYKVASNPNEIPPTDGVYTEPLNINIADNLANVNYLRAEIKAFLANIENSIYVRVENTPSIYECLEAKFELRTETADLYIANVITNLENASMQLGFDLAEQRKKAQQTKEVQPEEAEKKTKK